MPPSQIVTALVIWVTTLPSTQTQNCFLLLQILKWFTLHPAHPCAHCPSLSSPPTPSSYVIWGTLTAACCFHCLVTKSYLTLCDHMDCSIPGSPVLHCLPEFAQTHVHWVCDAILPSWLLSPPPPAALNHSSIRVFSNESALCIRWPKYWSFSFSISPSNEYSRLISFRIDWFDLLAV